MTFRVTGIDVALMKTGIARVDGTFESYTPTSEGYARHWQVAERILRVVEHDEPDVVVLEGYFVHPRRPLSTATLIEIGGIVRAMLDRAEVVFAHVPPAALKAYATGSGNADKPKVFDAARAELDDLALTGSPYLYPANYDEADAYWLRAMGRARYAPETLSLRERANRAVRFENLNAVEWPVLA